MSQFRFSRLPDIGGSKLLHDKGVKIHTLVSFEGH